LPPPRFTACGSLAHYVAFGGLEDFQPANISFGLLETLEPIQKIRDKKERRRIQVQEALRSMDDWISQLHRQPQSS
jgi:methylenetetrahydrofolate--tRNA-(uracil-5-)-methyltransferase